MIKLLIEDQRADVNACDHCRGNTPLMVAVKQHPKFVQMLLQHKDIDVNIQNKKGNTALHILGDIKSHHSTL